MRRIAPLMLVMAALLLPLGLGCTDSATNNNPKAETKDKSVKPIEGTKDKGKALTPGSA
jgi:hypothetical protein